MTKSQLFDMLVLLLVWNLWSPIIALVSPENVEGLFDDPEDLSIRDVSTEEELNAALVDTRVTRLVLTEHVIVKKDIIINRDIIIDLNGHNIISCGQGMTHYYGGKPMYPVNNARVLDVLSGKVELTGSGHILALGTDSAAMRIRGATDAAQENYTHVIIGHDVILNAPNYYALFITPNFNAAFGVKIDLAGTIIARDGICINSRINQAGSNAPMINVTDGAKITVDENEGIALYAAGYGIWNIHSAEITGATGICLKTGKLNLHDTKIVATGASDEYGGGAVVQFEENEACLVPAQIIVDGGAYQSRENAVFAQADLADEIVSNFTVLGGSFIGHQSIYCLDHQAIFANFSPELADLEIMKIYGGNYNSEIQKFLTAGYHTERQTQTGMYLVIDEVRLEEIDEATKLEHARLRLENLITLAENYTNGEYTGKELGELQPATNKAIASIKRALSATKKLVKTEAKPTIEQLENGIQKLNRAMENLQKIEDDLRADIYAAIAGVREMSPTDYSRYSYNILIKSVKEMESLLQNDDITLKNLYSAFCDIELNLDLLEGAEEDFDLEDELDPLETLGDPVIPAVHSSLNATLTAAPTLAVLTESSIPKVALSDEELFKGTPEDGLREESEEAELEREMEDFVFVDELDDETEFASESDNFGQLDDFNLETEFDISTTEPLHSVFDLPPIPQTLSATSSDLAPEVDEADNIAEMLDEAAVVADDLEQAEIDATTVTLIEEAKANLRTILEVVHDLRASDYRLEAAEQFGELQVAIARATVLLTRNDILPEEIMAVMDEIKIATAGLKGLEMVNPVSKNNTIVEDDIVESEDMAPVDWSALQMAVSEIGKLNPDNYTASSYAIILSELEHAKAVLATNNATQLDANQVVNNLYQAYISLVPIQSYVQTYNTTVTSPAASATVAPAINQAVGIDDTMVTPNLLMSMMAGAYAGLATYRKSRLEAKRRKVLSRQAQV